MAADEETDAFVALVAVVQRVVSLSSTRRSVAGVPIAPRHLGTLSHITRDQPVGMSDLAGRLNTSLASMSTIVTELEDLGLVERTPDPRDRRRTRVSVRPEHQAAVHELYEQRLTPIRHALRRLGPAERKALLHSLHVLSEELDQAIADAVAAAPTDVQAAR